MGKIISVENSKKEAQRAASELQKYYPQMKLVARAERKEDKIDPILRLRIRGSFSGRKGFYGVSTSRITGWVVEVI